MAVSQTSLVCGDHDYFEKRCCHGSCRICVDGVVSHLLHEFPGVWGPGEEGESGQGPSLRIVGRVPARNLMWHCWVSLIPRLLSHALSFLLSPSPACIFWEEDMTHSMHCWECTRELSLLRTLPILVSSSVCVLHQIKICWEEPWRAVSTV